MSSLFFSSLSYQESHPHVVKLTSQFSKIKWGCYTWNIKYRDRVHMWTWHQGLVSSCIIKL